MVHQLIGWLLVFCSHIFSSNRLKDGKEIELIARIKVMKKPVEGKTQTLHSLVIESVSKADSGVYTCILTNEAGEEICSAELEVLGNAFVKIQCLGSVIFHFL